MTITSQIKLILFLSQLSQKHQRVAYPNTLLYFTLHGNFLDQRAVKPLISCTFADDKGEDWNNKYVPCYFSWEHSRTGKGRGEKEDDKAYRVQRDES